MPNSAPYNTVTLNGFIYKIHPWSYQDIDVPYFAQQRREGQPTFSGYVPEVPTFWDSWHLGYGQLYFDGSPSYYTANGLDASIQRQITLSLAACSTGMTNGNQMEPIQQWIPFQQTLYAVGSTGVYKWTPSASPNGWSLSFAGSINNQTFGQATVYSVASLSATASLPAGQYLIVPGASWMNFFGGGASPWVPVGTSAAHLSTIRNEMWKVYYDQYGMWQIAKTTDGVTYPNPNNLSTLADTGAATINSLLNYDNRLFLYGANGLTTLDSLGTVYSVAPEFGKFQDARINRGEDIFHGVAYFPSDFGLLSYNGSVVLNPTTIKTVNSVGPDVKTWHQSDVRGHFRSVAPDVNYMYATLNSDAGNGYVLKYRDYPDAKPGQGWHPIQKFTNSYVGACSVVQLPWYGTPYPTLWFSAGTQIYQMRLPTETDNPLTNTSLQYQTLGTLDLPIIDDGMPTLQKAFQRFVVEFSAPSSTSVGMYASIDGGPFNSVGGNITATTAVFEFDFPLLSTGGHNVQPRLQLSASTNAPTATQSPYVRSIVLHHLIRPIQRERWTFQIVAENSVFPSDNLSAHDKIVQLRKARNTVGPIVFQDLFNESHLATVDMLNIRQTDRKEGSGPGFMAEVALMSYAVIKSFTGSAFTQISQTSDPLAPTG